MELNTDTTTGESHLASSVNIYIHDHPASFKSQFLQKLMAILGRKTLMERNIRRGRFASVPVPLPKRLPADCKCEVSEVEGRNVWTLKPEREKPRNVILYIHGGGYMTNLTKYDWDFVEQLLIKTRCTIVAPDYPLIPQSNYTDVYRFFEILYLSLLSDTTHENIIFMGNSAGGGIALGLAQKFRNEGRPQPAQIILISPWLDITMSNPEIAALDRSDKLLGITGLKMAGQAYAADLDPTDFRVSPIYGEFSGLGRISLFIGTHDLFLADARKLKEKLGKQNITMNYFEYPKMFHVWIALTDLKESQHAIDEIVKLVRYY